MEEQPPTGIGERIERVLARIRTACEDCGRDPSGVRLVAVSKTRTPGEVRAAAEAGLTVFGENRVQEAAAKIPLCPDRLEWHLVGHLQGNKVRNAVRLFRCLHSVDSLERLQQVDAECERQGVRLPVFLQVNVSGEASKSGMPPESVESALRAADRLFAVEILGLMTIPPVSEDPERARGFFRVLSEVRARCRAATGHALPGLSMGMSHDLEIAVQEGATHVRVGTDLFGPRYAPAG